MTLFETPRFRCRRWVAADVDDIYGVYSDEESARFVGDGQPITHDDSERWIEVTLNNYKTRGYGMFAIEDRSTDLIVGFCGLVHPDNQTHAEIKYAFYKQHWGKGFASEVVPAMLAYATTELDIKRVIATVAAGNLASQRVLAKAGARLLTVMAETPDQTHLYEWQPRL